MDFYMTLPSNGGGIEFNRANNNTRYKVRLPNRLVLKEQDWEVALVFLSFPIRDYHKYHILSSFQRGKIVTKVSGRVTYVTTRNIRHYERGRDDNTVTGPAGFRQITSINWDDYVELHNPVNWETIGLDSGRFEQAFSSKYRVVRILSNICDS